MFNNIGEKIKSLARILSIVAMIGFVATGIVILIIGVWWVGVLIIAGGVLLSWVSSFVLYGFGELISKTTEIAEVTKNSNKEIKKEEVKEEMTKEERG